MIPKVIHFCWLSDDEYPEKIKTCIQSWKRILPDYEIRLWDLKRFDLQSSIWVKEAYTAKKYAFAADYIRCYALYTEGGIYLDSDVEVLRSFDSLLELPYFIGEEQGGNLEPAVMGCQKGWPFLGKMLEYYKGRHFINESGMDMETLPVIMSKEVCKRYEYIRISSKDKFKEEKGSFCVFPAEYFSPKYPNAINNCPITKETYAIHHFAASWYSTEQNVFRIVRMLFGYQVAHFLSVVAMRLLGK